MGLRLLRNQLSAVALVVAYAAHGYPPDACSLRGRGIGRGSIRGIAPSFKHDLALAT